MGSPFAKRSVGDNLPESQEKRSLRELERIAIYGETELPLEFARLVTGYQDFKLGVIARFKDTDDTIVNCRYVRFMDGVPDDATRAVGQLEGGNAYEATHLPTESHQGMILGVSMVQGNLPVPCYGWAQVDGIRDLPDLVAFAFGDTVYWHSNGSITDNPDGAHGVVGIAMGLQRIHVKPWFGMPNEALPPYLISDITGLQTIIDNLLAEAGGGAGVFMESLSAVDAPEVGAELDFDDFVRTTHTMQVETTGAPTTCEVELQVFIGTWATIATWTLVDGRVSGDIVSVADIGALKIRAELTALAGGVAPTVTATITSK